MTQAFAPPRRRRQEASLAVRAVPAGETVEDALRALCGAGTVPGIASRTGFEVEVVRDRLHELRQADVVWLQPRVRGKGAMRRRCNTAARVWRLCEVHAPPPELNAQDRDTASYAARPGNTNSAALAPVLAVLGDAGGLPMGEVQNRTGLGRNAVLTALREGEAAGRVHVRRSRGAKTSYRRT